MKEITEISLVDRLREFMENEARACSMDPGCITAMYVYRMWGGSVALEEIERAMKEIFSKSPDPFELRSNSVTTRDS